MTDRSNYGRPGVYFLSSIVCINSNFNLAHSVIKNYLLNEFHRNNKWECSTSLSCVVVGPYHAPVSVNNIFEIKNNLYPLWCCHKFLKSLGMISEVMPVPVSLTLTIKSVSLSRLTVMVPSVVNSTALFIKLEITCVSLPLSASAMRGNSF